MYLLLNGSMPVKSNRIQRFCMQHVQDLCSELAGF